MRFYSLSFWKLLGCWLILWPSLLLAAANPVAVLDNISKQMQAAISEQEVQLKKNPNLINELVNGIIAPHMDFVEMSRWVVGRTAWQRAKPQDQKEFTAAFRDLLIKTYARALLSYRDYKIEYMPLREEIGGKKRIQVNSSVRLEGTNPISMAYRLLLEADQWRVYDIIIEGVSLLKGFQSQFAEDLQQDGLPAVTAKILQHNREQTGSS